MQEKVAIIGAGAWGTALAKVLVEKGEKVSLWVFEPGLAERITSRHENDLYLPGLKLPKKIQATPDIAEAVSGAGYLVFVVPSRFLRKVVKTASEKIKGEVIAISCTKGLEERKLSFPTEILRQSFRARGIPAPVVVLSGPSFAREVAQGVPTAVVSASSDREAAEQVQKLFSNPLFRVYTNPDPLGVEISGVLKNVVAIAVGISDGLDLGLNTRAALITRGLAEMTRLGVKLGANPLTFSGLSGMGDLVLTCTGDLSRNRQVGLALAQGKKLDEILAGMKAVAEGVSTVKAVRKLAHKIGVEMPIVEQVFAVLYKNKEPIQAASDLMARRLKYEHESIGRGWPE
ncbi:MAG: NAD(P)-dependent glycerol-3-phosphate dehydrogenase [Proteobacteria bacterium]|nr:NAD(P)-dependent glycerol-3-phosphate dehydrogenase [Pseudomonadota bacterium]